MTFLAIFFTSLPLNNDYCLVMVYTGNSLLVHRGSLALNTYTSAPTLCMRNIILLYALYYTATASTKYAWPVHVHTLSTWNSTYYTNKLYLQYKLLLALCIHLLYSHLRSLAPAVKKLPTYL